jgi:hypothetical protein
VREGAGENVEFLARLGNQEGPEWWVPRDGKEREGKLVIRDPKEL